MKLIWNLRKSSRQIVKIGQRQCNMDLADIYKILLNFCVSENLLTTCWVKKNWQVWSQFLKVFSESFRGIGFLLNQKKFFKYGTTIQVYTCIGRSRNQICMSNVGFLQPTEVFNFWKIWKIGPKFLSHVFLRLICRVCFFTCLATEDALKILFCPRVYPGFWEFYSVFLWE